MKNVPLKFYLISQYWIQIKAGDQKHISVVYFFNRVLKKNLIMNIFGNIYV